MWDINLREISDTFNGSHKTQSKNFVFSGDKTKTELAQYVHACLSPPCLKTLEKAIARGNLITWSVGNLNFSNLIKTSLATEKRSFRPGTEIS